MARRKRRGRDPRREHERLIRALQRARIVVAVLGVVPLLLSYACAAGGGGLCVVPNEWYPFLWAGAIGAFMGLTIRIVRERRTFERAKR